MLIFGQKTRYLILYSCLLNLTTQIAIVCTVVQQKAVGTNKPATNHSTGELQQLPLWGWDPLYVEMGFTQGDIIGPSMSFYPDFIQILSRFYPDFILILSFKN